MKTIHTKVVTNEDLQRAQAAVATHAQLIDALYGHRRLPMESRIKVDLAADQHTDFEIRVERLTSATYDTFMNEMNVEIEQLERLCSATGISPSALWPTRVQLGIVPR